VKASETHILSEHMDHGATSQPDVDFMFIIMFIRLCLPQLYH